MTYITQYFIPSFPQSIPVREFSRRHASSAARLLESPNVIYVGLAIKKSSSGRVELMAIATASEIYVISADIDSRTFLPSDAPFEKLLAGTTNVLVGFGMPRLALRLSQDFDLPVCGIDLSTLRSPSTRDPWQPSKLVASKISPSVNKLNLDNLWNGHSEQGHRDVCLRAWVSACTAERCIPDLNCALKVETSNLNKNEMSCLGELLRQADILDEAKPNEVPNEFSNAKLSNDGSLFLHNARYRSRVRKGRNTAIIMTNTKGREYVGRARSAVGKNTSIKFVGEALSGTLQSVRVVGRQDLTNSEKARDELLLQLLRGEKTMRRSLFIRKLWFPTMRDRSATEIQNSATPVEILGLNPSQIDVVSQMVSTSPLLVVHGPPGTGKTTAISAAAAIWNRQGDPAWIVAHSNVAVKNIAETLYKRGVDFKILVSKEFHLEWHEHIYSMIQDKLIRSDELPDNIIGMERTLGRSCIVLSTLSMLSNPALDTNGIFTLIPIKRLVIDEASQIKIFDFLHVFEKFGDLQQVCFFGDPKQLPPYGQDAVPDLKTIFDVEYLNKSAKFLNTQYRMPVPLGQFISHYVYGGRLESQHKSNLVSCISFVDASNGEEVKGGFSWKNPGEVQTIVHIVRNYYKHKNFCIITPYDAQRAEIEKQLKYENLPWERVFNVDSFQGNEAEYVIISIVRTGSPGFLASLNRMNVMFTRCKMGLVVVTSRVFTLTGGQNTLLGRLARHWETLRGESTWVDWMLVAEGRVDLPGAPGPKRAKNIFLESTARYVNGGSPLPSQPWAQPVGSEKKFDVSALFRKPTHLVDTKRAQAVPDTSMTLFPNKVFSQSQQSSKAINVKNLTQVRRTIALPTMKSNHWQGEKQCISDFPNLPTVDVPQGKRNLNSSAPLTAGSRYSVLQGHSGTNAWIAQHKQILRPPASYSTSSERPPPNVPKPSHGGAELTLQPALEREQPWKVVENKHKGRGWSKNYIVQK